MRILLLLAASALLGSGLALAVAPAIAQSHDDEAIPYGTQCGVELWAKKTLRDPAAAYVNFTPQVTTAKWLDSRTAPADPDNVLRRLSPIETTAWKITVELVGYKIEAGGDYHLVLRDPTSGAQLIGEIPASYCVASRGELYTRLRHTIDHIGGHRATKRWWWLDYRGARPPTIVVAGVGFFDRVHVQNGVAPNGVELHPVLAISRP